MAIEITYKVECHCGCVVGIGDLDVQASSEDCALDDEDEPEEPEGSDGPEDSDGSECIECGSSANPCDCGDADRGVDR